MAKLFRAIKRTPPIDQSCAFAFYLIRFHELLVRGEEAKDKRQSKSRGSHSKANKCVGGKKKAQQQQQQRQQLQQQQQQQQRSRRHLSTYFEHAMFLCKAICSNRKSSTYYCNYRLKHNLPISVVTV